LKKSDKTSTVVPEPPALTIETRENQLIALAMNLAEKRMREGKASSQEIVYFLKASSPDEKLKRQLLEAQAELARAKADAIKQSQQNAELIAEALSAFKEYSGDDHLDQGYEDI